MIPIVMVFTMPFLASSCFRPTSFIHGFPKRGPYQMVPRTIQAITLRSIAVQLREEKGNIIRELREYEEL